eukprot:scaffold85369_cov17-Prasinocladus_malaysianus.AAC.1
MQARAHIARSSMTSPQCQTNSDAANTVVKTLVPTKGFKDNYHHWQVAFAFQIATICPQRIFLCGHHSICETIAQLKLAGDRCTDLSNTHLRRFIKTSTTTPAYINDTESNYAWLLK